MTTPTFGPLLAIPALPVHDNIEQYSSIFLHKQYLMMLLLPPTHHYCRFLIRIQSLRNTSHLPNTTTAQVGYRTFPYLHLLGAWMVTGCHGQGTTVVDDSGTPDQTPDFLVDWKARSGGKSGGFRPIDDDCEEDGKTHAYGLGFGFGCVPQGWGHGQKHVSGYTSNYGTWNFEWLPDVSIHFSWIDHRGFTIFILNSKIVWNEGKSAHLEPQRKDNEDSSFNSDLAEHHDNKDQEEEEKDHYPFPRYRCCSREFHFDTFAEVLWI